MTTVIRNVALIAAILCVGSAPTLIASAHAGSTVTPMHAVQAMLTCDPTDPACDVYIHRG